ncbi:molybdopterin-dependent oxidoreductase [Pantoea sp. S62]|uniref:molybdopterin-dependent oxidoreductase n=1 Tax=Pantoea sp. S62 TaxID=2769342 RepID=UPI001911D8A6|nr:molybdopterin-dependent oxidoreductase [Pantoea sp. S62]MBK5017940.1 molybdopterin-dependent oxidoreductase [Pantoea sp. S62]
MKLFTAILFSLLSAKAAYADSFVLADGSKEINVSTEDLLKLPVTSITTATNFTPKATFEGVPFTELLSKYSITASSLRVYALDDYSYTLPVEELLKYQVILAFRKNDKVIPVSDLGPFAVIYPRDQHPELNKLDVNAKTVWQINRIEAIK